MPKVTLVLDDNDVGQILDGLRERMADWRYTARYLEDGLVDDDRVCLECSDAAEACAIADHYQRVIASIERQLACQRPRSRLSHRPLRPEGPKEE